MSPEEDFKPHRLIHRPAMFTCHSGGCDVGYRERPERDVASGLLEEVGEWYRAVASLQRTNVPGGVSDALEALHEAACGWVDWLDRSNKKDGDQSPLPRGRNER